MRDMRLWRLVLALVLAVPAAGGLQAQETGQVAGTVTNEQGQPVATASVVVQGTRLAVVTDLDGKYVIPEVPAGPRTVVARLIGFGVATQVVTVTAGQIVVADFRQPRRQRRGADYHQRRGHRGGEDAVHGRRVRNRPASVRPSHHDEPAAVPRDAAGGRALYRLERRPQLGPERAAAGSLCRGP